MKQVLIRQGEVVVDEVPAPQVSAGTCVVAVEYSCVSAGTELGSLQQSAQPLWKRAIKEPQSVTRVLRMAAEQGLGHTYDSVRGVLQAGHPTGYSAAGRILEVGAGIHDLHIGQPVACAGAGLANHAQVVRVPRNLIAAVPAGVELADACTATLGAIALQGVRRLEPTLGEVFVVIGLGLIGQLTVQLLRASGCRVIGVDLDPPRLAVATEAGLECAIVPTTIDAVARVHQLTDDHGADGVVITAATRSDEVVSDAFRMCRRKGRVVLVGDVGLHLRRSDFYANEIDFRISTSYGPGRYDQRYEQEGLDYPIGYVRWTENRNLGEYLRLLHEKKINLAPLKPVQFSIDQATRAFAALSEGESSQRPILVLLTYPALDSALVQQRRVRNPQVRPSKAGALRVAVIGAGSFATAVHLPNLRAMPDRFALHAVADRRGHNAADLARQHGATYSTTDAQQVLDDEQVDLVLITTRHNLHAALVLAALRRGKHVLVEKPLAMNEQELAGIEALLSDGDEPKPILMTGFNRRFSPHASRIRNLLRERSGPLVISYRMNAGSLPEDHWTQGPEGGGRNIGEACHIYDLFTCLTGARTHTVTAQSIMPNSPKLLRNDNFSATITFDDGSLANLLYTARGSSGFPKETMEIFTDGKVLSLTDYRQLETYGIKGGGYKTTAPEKGHRQELIALSEAIRATAGTASWPIPLWQQLQAMRVAFEVQTMIMP